MKNNLPSVIRIDTIAFDVRKVSVNKIYNSRNLKGLSSKACAHMPYSVVGM